MSLYVKLPGLLVSFFLSPVLKVASRLAAMGSGRISGSSFFWMLGAKKKGYQSASLTLCQRVTGPHLGKSAALKWNTMPTGTPISYSTWPTVPGHLSVYPAWKTCLVQKKLVYSLI